MPLPAPAEPESEPEPKPDEGRLIQIDRGKPGKVFELTKDRVIIGRLPESDVSVNDPGVSRRHAEIRRQDGNFLLVDLGSTNGTRVNEAPIGERVLEEGDRITVGRTVLEFRRG